MKKKRLSSREKSNRGKVGIDRKTNQDFPGYPHGISTEEHITPRNETERKLAALDVKDGEKMLNTPAKRKQKQDEAESDGSGGAFEGTEEVRD